MARFSPRLLSADIRGAVDRWIDPTRRPAGMRGLRQARIVVVEGWIGLLAHAILAVTLILGQVPLVPLIEVALAILVTTGALAMVRWGGRVEPAAWVMALTLALTR